MARFGFAKVVLFLPLLLTPALLANAQTASPTPQVIAPPPKTPLQVAGRTNCFCAGYIRLQRLPEMPQIVGAVEEQEQRMFADGEIVYINAGSSQGVKEGQNFQIIRPRGDVKGVHRQKRGFLGTYIQEVGQLQVFKVRENTSAAQITSSCGEMVMLGDLLTAMPDRDSPLQRTDVEARSVRGSDRQAGRTPDDGQGQSRDGDRATTWSTSISASRTTSNPATT